MSFDNSLSIGSLLQGGKYRILKVLGKGGFGITYLSEQVGLHRKVAIKEFFMSDYCNRNHDSSHVEVPSVGSRELVTKYRSKFIKEAQTIAELDNNHIIRIHDIFEENGTAYYVMEYLPTGSLLDCMPRTGFSESVSLSYIRQVSSALSYIHKKKILHLDIKPSNLLLRESGEIVLIDFGISKHYDEIENSQTSTTPVGISDGYTPIEQYEHGGVSSFSSATDIYALGATLYCLLSGHKPPKASIVLNTGLPSLPSHISLATQTAVNRAMCPRRLDRPQSVEDFLKLLPTAFSNVHGNGYGVHNSGDIEYDNGVLEDDSTIFRSSSVSSSSAMINGLRVTWSSDVSSDQKRILRCLIENMVLVHGGSFEMGSTDSDAYSDERPIHRVTLSDYRLGKYEVTQEEWKAVMGSNPSRFKGDNLPVERVSWDDCQAFISKLNALTGLCFRLPTVAQWEYAARGGNRSEGYKYSGSNHIGDVAWYKENSGGNTHPVGKKLPNELGLYDMSGNVWEWCSDRCDEIYYSSSPSSNPAGPDWGSDSGSFYVSRGGCWLYDAGDCRVSYRGYSAPSIARNNLGFRLAF